MAAVGGDESGKKGLPEYAKKKIKKYILGPGYEPENISQPGVEKDSDAKDQERLYWIDVIQSIAEPGDAQLIEYKGKDYLITDLLAHGLRIPNSYNLNWDHIRRFIYNLNTVTGVLDEIDENRHVTTPVFYTYDPGYKRGGYVQKRNHRVGRMK